MGLKLNKIKMQNDHRRRTHYWHCIMKSNRRRIITIPNIGEGFQFPLSLPSNGSGISTMRWIEYQVQGKRFPSKCFWTHISDIPWTLIEALTTEAHCNIHPAKYLHCPWLLIKTVGFTVHWLFRGVSLSVWIDFGIVIHCLNSCCRKCEIQA